MYQKKKNTLSVSATLILEITQCIYLGDVYTRNSTMQKIGSFVLQQARSFTHAHVCLPHRRMPPHLCVRSYLGQRCNCILRNGCCDEEIYKLRLISAPVFGMDSRAYIMRFPLIFRYIRPAHL